MKASTFKTTKKIKLDIKEDFLYIMMEVCVYRTEKSGCSFNFTSDVQRFLLHLCPLFAGQMFSSRLKLSHYQVLCGDSQMEMSLHLFMLHESFVLLGTF